MMKSSAGKRSPHETRFDERGDNGTEDGQSEPSTDDDMGRYGRSTATPSARERREFVNSANCSHYVSLRLELGLSAQFAFPPF